mgnify:CR=1 FL=1
MTISHDGWTGEEWAEKQAQEDLLKTVGETHGIAKAKAINEAQSRAFSGMLSGWRGHDTLGRLADVLIEALYLIRKLNKEREVSDDE